MEECLITKKLLSEDKIVYTLDGPIAVFLWGREPIKTKDGFALIPKSLAEKYKTAISTTFDREANPEAFE